MKPRLMLVDDDPVGLDCLSGLLRHHLPLAAIMSFTDPAVALLRLREELFDVVLTDFNMPGMNGMTLLRAARESGSDASFIVMTGDATDEILTEGLRLGMFALLNKPLSRATVVPLVHQASECHRLRQEVAALRRTLIESGVGPGDWMQTVSIVPNEDSQALLPY